MISFVDITSHKQNEEYQRQLSHQAVERRRKQECFIDIFSHELRNPFSATLQSADAILSALSSFQSAGKKFEVEELIDSAQTILVCVQHQMRIIDDVLTLSKLESLALTVVPVSIRPHECVAQMLKIFHSELQAKHIHSKFIIEDSYKENAVDWVMADPSRFSQVLVNLLTNAIKFSSPVSANRCEITVRLAASKTRPVSHHSVPYQTYSPTTDNPNDPESSPDYNESEWGTGEPLYIQAMVEDTGIGISKKWQAKLFRRFEQVPKTHVTYGGSGLGLFICRRLCHIQGGEIGFHSEEDKGSRFAFYIRACRSDGPGAGPASGELTTLSNFRTDSAAGAPTVINMSVVSSAIPAPAPAATPMAYRVLIVEDNLINQEVLRRQLRSKGCVTHVANNGQQALDFVRTSSYGSGTGENLDIILMDMEMPVMDGCEATRRIRAMQAAGALRGHVPIMGISANARPEQIAMMTRAGMDDAITKPFRIPALLDAFGKLMRNLKISVAPVAEPLCRVKPEVASTGSLLRTASVLQHEESDDPVDAHDPKQAPQE